MLIQDRLRATGIVTGRVLVAALFLHESWALLTNYSPSAAYMEKFSVPGALLPIVITTQLVGGALVAAGWNSRLATLALAAFCMGAAILFHTNFAVRKEMLHFEKDLALAGALLLLSINEVHDTTWALARTVFARPA